MSDMDFDDAVIQNIDNHPRALVIRRIGAFLVDILILFVILAPSGFLVMWTLGYQPWWQLSDDQLSGPIIWSYALLNFSLPTWLYFTLSDWLMQGATLGKRLFRLRVMSGAGEGLSVGQALGRTAIKFLPWELAHISVFALSYDMSGFSLWQYVGLGLTYGLAIFYLVVAVVTRGRRSVHDLIVGAEVGLIQSGTYSFAQTEPPK